VQEHVASSLARFSLNRRWTGSHPGPLAAGRAARGGAAAGL